MKTKTKTSKKTVKKTVKKSTKESAKKQTVKTKYIPVHARTLKASEVSSTITKHYSHNPNASAIRGKENAQIRNTIEKGIFKPTHIDLNKFNIIFAKLDKKIIEKMFTSKSLFKKLKDSIGAILKKLKCHTKGIYSFNYKARDTKEGNFESLKTRVRTALRAKHLNNETLDKLEIHKVR